MCLRTKLFFDRILSLTTNERQKAPLDVKDNNAASNVSDKHE